MNTTTAETTNQWEAADALMAKVIEIGNATLGQWNYGVTRINDQLGSPTARVRVTVRMRRGSWKNAVEDAKKLRRACWDAGLLASTKFTTGAKDGGTFVLKWVNFTVARA